MTRQALTLLATLALAPLTTVSAQTVYDPVWGAVTPTQTVSFTYDTNLSPMANGNLLEVAIEGLTPGTRLEVGDGTYIVNGLLQIDLIGTASAPIWIAAAPGASPVIARSNLNQNTVNFGKTTPARYVALQGFELTGGSTGLKLWDVENVWIDSCYVHDCDGNGIEANSHDSSFLHITRNEVHSTAKTGEGMYLGANNGAILTHDSVIALNYVHDTGGSQGDGIELKQGSYGNWIVGNTVHDTNYPGILVYGTDGQARNVVERNLVYNSNDNAMQVQGDAIVRNNLVMNGALVAFSSSDHQGPVQNLTVVHNTFINSGRAVKLSDWNNAPSVDFSNNASYSENAEALYFAGGSNGVFFKGNVAFGSVVGPTGSQPGQGLSDFVDVTWNATQRDARPSATGALVASGNTNWAVVDDLTGATRVGELESGCYDFVDAAVATSYCTAGTSASGCQAALSATGAPSATAASGFVVSAAHVEGLKDGLYFFGDNGRQAAPWGNGTSLQCVTPPVVRTGLQLGVGSAGTCDGSFSQDLNAVWTANPIQNPGSGAVVQLQLWYRDPFNTSNRTTSLSDALEFTVQP